MSKRQMTCEFVVEMAVSVSAAQQAALVASLGYLDADLANRDGVTWVRLRVLAVNREEAESYARWRLGRQGVGELRHSARSIAVAS